MSEQRTIVILNTASGSQGGEEKIAAIRDAFNARGKAVDFVNVQDHDSVEAAAKAALTHTDARIAVAGGDGTICGTASVLAGSGREIGIIPAGTFNYFGRSLGLPEEIDAAVEVVLSGVPRDVNVATVNGRMFLNNASIGAYAAILQTREGTYKRWGRSRLAAYWSVMKTLVTFRAPLKLDVDIDGKKLTRRTPLLFVINNAYQLEEMGLDGAEAIAEGNLVTLIAPNSGRLGLLRHAAALALGIAKAETDYEMISGKKIEISMKRKRRPVARDGEITRMGGPFTIRHAHHPLRILVAPDASKAVR
ncbi:diacylglycerol O-acyltransferase [Sulfitobacter alexandrii]|uniref:Diacylglycerol O-acyltransferase n=1 Tax=Sulfitobacter alexandrii TaxID=1917485 RepID=A0A1J0WLW4_9RHOB|nr:diacylglycerol kinase family protein [Sulfitobacter alexandrii]APE45160.1 diacylglycerol O-acyltransferase [Sulfitobacter alexandrii]